MIRSILITAIAVFGLSGVSSAQKQAKTATIEFPVAGVCEMCKERIEDAALISGVKFAEWDQETHSIKVIYNQKKVTTEEIHTAIANVGHDTDKVAASDSAYIELPACCKYRDGVTDH